MSGKNKWNTTGGSCEGWTLWGAARRQDLQTGRQTDILLEELEAFGATSFKASLIPTQINKNLNSEDITEKKPHDRQPLIYSISLHLPYNHTISGLSLFAPFI